VPAEPFENLRATMAGARPDAFEGTTEGGGSCPFAAALGGAAEASEPAAVTWDAAAAARLERIPAFIRPMARRSIERICRRARLRDDHRDRDGRGPRPSSDVRL